MSVIQGFKIGDGMNIYDYFLIGISCAEVIAFIVRVLFMLDQKPQNWPDCRLGKMFFQR